MFIFALFPNLPFIFPLSICKSFFDVKILTFKYTANIFQESLGFTFIEFENLYNIF